jgi:hypothetical protein
MRNRDCQSTITGVASKLFGGNGVCLPRNWDKAPEFDLVLMTPGNAVMQTREFLMYGSFIELSAFSFLTAQVFCALFASVLATDLVALTSAERFEGMNFRQRFAFILWRYTLPAGVFSLAMYWFVFGHLQS